MTLSTTFASTPLGRVRRSWALSSAAAFVVLLFLATPYTLDYRLDLDSAWLDTIPLPKYPTSYSSTPAWNREAFGEVNVAVWEAMYHDEVTGTLGKGLADVGTHPVFSANFRYGFPEIMEAVMPGAETHNTNAHKMEEALTEDAVDLVVLPTCKVGLTLLWKFIGPSKAHVVCVWHAASFYPSDELKGHMRELGAAGRISFLVLNNEVQRSMKTVLATWAERERDPSWDIPVEYIAPVFDYPANQDKERPAIWPTTAVIQGNLDRKRRNYAQVFGDLTASLEEDPAVWGYRVNTEGSDLPWEPIPGASPFRLQLLGQLVKERPLEIPAKLANVVSMHQALMYPDYYQLLSESDVLVPAFAKDDYYHDAASSSIAAAAIARVPVLGSDRLKASYDYLDDAIVVPRDLWMGEIATLRQMRVDNTYMPPSNEQWQDVFRTIGERNMETWAAILSRTPRMKAEANV